MNIRSLTERLRHVVLAAAFLATFIFPAWAQFPWQQEKPKGPWMDKTMSPDKRADLVVGQMTLDEKTSLLHGGGWRALFGGPDAPPTRSLGGAGFIPGIPRLGIPDLQMADAAVGVTRGSAFGRYSTGLPSGVS
jgi:beta-glucosidase